MFVSPTGRSSEVAGEASQPPEANQELVSASRFHQLSKPKEVLTFTSSKEAFDLGTVEMLANDAERLLHRVGLNGRVLNLSRSLEESALAGGREL